MAGKAKITVAVDADSRGLRRGLRDAEADVTSFGEKVVGRLASVQRGVGQITSLAGLVTTAINAAAKIRELVEWMQHLGDVSEEAAASARTWVAAAAGSGLDPVSYAAVEDAAARAGVPAEKLAATLRRIAETGGGIREVAEALGLAADKLERAAAPGTGAAVRAAALGYAAVAAGRQTARAKAKSDREAEAEGLHAMAADAYSLSAPRQRVVDAWAAAIRAMGDVEGAKALLSRQITWWDRHRPDVANRLAANTGMDTAIPAALAKIKAEDAAAAAAKADAAEKASAAAASAKAGEQAREKARADREAEARAAEEARAKAADARLVAKASASAEGRRAALERVTVQGPLAANALAASGGYLGGALDNAARMERERQRSIDEINRKFGEVGAALKESARSAGASESALARIAAILEEG